MDKLVIASQNPGKTREITQILDDLPLTCLSLPALGISEDVEETGDSYAANALLKAEFASRCTGLAALGDDSGLEVAALGGRPGLYTARYAPSVPERWARLLGELKDVPWEARGARFVCVIALSLPGQAPVILEGECRGLIAFEPRGAGGFGYDPLFFLPDYGCTMAELDEPVKNRVSHRARAVLKAKEFLDHGLR
jgi:XTP/dITP diphosphohydrolase